MAGNRVFYYVMASGSGSAFCKGYARYDEARAAYEALAWSMCFATLDYRQLSLMCGERVIESISL